MSIGVQTLGATRATQAELPGSSDVYFALFEDETATTECTDPNYARVAYSGWSQSVDGLVRTNTGAITFAAFAAKTHIGSIGWFDAAVGGDPVHTAVITFFEFGLDVDVGDFVNLGPGAFRLRAS